MKKRSSLNMEKSKMLRFCLIVIVAMCAWGYCLDLDARGADPYGPQGKRFGVGIIAGEPTGLSGKGYIATPLAIDAIVSWSFVDKALLLIGDLTYELFDIPVNRSSFSLPFYIGAGAKVGFDKGGKNNGRTIVGVRVPIGLGMQFQKYPLEVFIEAAPGIELAPSTEFDITGGIGVRYYFF